MNKHRYLAPSLTFGRFYCRSCLLEWAHMSCWIPPPSNSVTPQCTLALITTRLDANRLSSALEEYLCLRFIWVSDLKISFHSYSILKSMCSMLDVHVNKTNPLPSSSVVLITTLVKERHLWSVYICIIWWGSKVTG